MVLSMKKQHFENYCPAVITDIVTEEACDVIVPDSWPDAERICGSSGSVMVRSKECMSGKAVISGSAKVWVMYQTVDNEMRSMSAVLPYSIEMPNAAINESSNIIAQPRIISCEGKVINSRKLQVKASISVACTVMNNTEQVYCDGIESDRDLEIQCGEYPILITKAVKEKNFTISDELQLEDRKPSFGQMLAPSVTLKVTDKKLVGTKLVFKGEADISAIYSATDGGIENAEFNMPFSQIIDIDGIEESDIPWLCLSMTSCELEILDDYSENLRRLELNMNVLAQAIVSGQQIIKPVLDFYSTDYETTATTEPMELTSLLDNKTLRRNVRERISADGQPSRVLAASLTLPKREVTTEGGRVKAKQNLEASVIYIDQNGCVKTQRKKLDAQAELELAPNAQVDVACEIVVPATGTVSGGEIELSAELEFCFVCTAKQSPNILVDGEISDEAIDKKSRPSAILTRAEGDIWHIARKYGAKMSDIKAVNGIEDGEIGGRMILIPKSSGTTAGI